MYDQRIGPSRHGRREVPGIRARERATRPASCLTTRCADPAWVGGHRPRAWFALLLVAWVVAWEPSQGGSCSVSGAAFREPRSARTPASDLWATLSVEEIRLDDKGVELVARHPAGAIVRRYGSGEVNHLGGEGCAVYYERNVAWAVGSTTVQFVLRVRVDDVDLLAQEILAGRPPPRAVQDAIAGLWTQVQRMFPDSWVPDDGRLIMEYRLVVSGEPRCSVTNEADGTTGAPPAAGNPLGVGP
jgi:hypothetical protein